MKVRKIYSMTMLLETPSSENVEKSMKYVKSTNAKYIFLLYL